MPRKVKACTQCWRGYTLEAFRQLELIDIDPNDSAEKRRCSCGQAIVVDVRHVGALDNRTATEIAAERAFMARRARLKRRLSAVVAAALTLVVVIVALVLWR